MGGVSAGADVHVCVFSRVHTSGDNKTTTTKCDLTVIAEIRPTSSLSQSRLDTVPLPQHANDVYAQRYQREDHNVPGLYHEYLRVRSNFFDHLAPFAGANPPLARHSAMYPSPPHPSTPHYLPTECARDSDS